MKYFELFDCAHNLAKEIIESEEFIKLQKLEKIIMELPITKNFINAKEKYEEALKYGKYYPGLKEIQINLSKAKEILYTDSRVIEYKNLEASIQEKLDKIADELINTVKENGCDSKKMCNCVL